MIQYSYAKDSNGDIVDITSLKRSEGLDTYSCVNCGDELIPRLGKIRRKHFAHKEQRECSFETYLHKLAKEVFYNIYQSCLKKNRPFVLEYSVKQVCQHFQDEFGNTCNLGEKIKEFDLTTYFTGIELEKRDGSFIPDVRIFSRDTGESIYIEIAVTHESEKNKLNSGNRIIEFLVSEESDLMLFTSKRIDHNNEKIIRHNFSVNSQENINCQGNCPSEIDVFLVYKNGGGRLTEKKLKTLKWMMQSKEITYFKILDKTVGYDNGYAYVQNLVAAQEEGVGVKNCFLCRYHARNHYSRKDDGAIFCKFLKESCSSNKAIECGYYRPDESVYSEYRQNEPENS